MTRACAPAIEPSVRRYSTVTPSTSIRCTRAVALDQRRRVDARELAEGVLQRLGRQVRVQPRERLAQPPLQHDVAVVRVAALRAGLAGGDVRAVQHRVAQRFQPGEGGVFDDGFGEGAAGSRRGACRHKAQASSVPHAIARVVVSQEIASTALAIQSLNSTSLGRYSRIENPALTRTASSDRSMLNSASVAVLKARDGRGIPRSLPMKTVEESDDRIRCLRQLAKSRSTAAMILAGAEIQPSSAATSIYGRNVHSGSAKGFFVLASIGVALARKSGPLFAIRLARATKSASRRPPIITVAATARQR